MDSISLYLYIQPDYSYSLCSTELPLPVLFLFYSSYSVSKQYNTFIGLTFLKFTTETVWFPCDETLELVCEKFPTLCYFYQSEESGLAEYWTNDQEGKYFPDKYIADLCTPDDKWYKEYFVNQTEVFKWFEVISGQSVESITEILAIAEQRKDENEQFFL